MRCGTSTGLFEQVNIKAHILVLRVLGQKVGSGQASEATAYYSDFDGSRHAGRLRISSK